METMNSQEYYMQKSAKKQMRAYSKNADGKPSEVSPLEDRKMRTIQAEIKHMQDNGSKVPDISKITMKEFDELYNMSQRQRRNFYAIIRRKQNLEDVHKVKKEIKRIVSKTNQQRILEERTENGHIHYGLGKNSLFMRIRTESLNKWRHRKIFKIRKTGGSEIIFDCELDKSFKPAEITKAAHELQKCVAYNRLHSQPFYMNFCNLSSESALSEKLHKLMPGMSKSTFPLSIHNDSFTEHFSKERLVYLTTFSSVELHEFNHDDIYILGSMADNSPRMRSAFNRAVSSGVRTARLPIDRYVESPRSKILTLEQIMKVLLEIKYSRNWKTAMKYVPLRLN